MARQSKHLSTAADPLDAFMKEYFLETQQNPIDPRLRVWIVGDTYVFTEIRKWAANNSIHIHSIFTEPGHHKTGAAATVMKNIVCMADQYGVALDLTAKPFKLRGEQGLTAAQLKAWYKRLGFTGKGSELRRRGV